MCRYGTNYKPHYACFECRKAFKRRLFGDVYGGSKDEPSPAKCPDCGSLVADMGLDFKAPKKKEEKAWKHLKDLFTVGLTFHSCGCYGPGYRPRDTASLIAYLEDKKAGFVEARRYWSQAGLPEEIRRPNEPNAQQYAHTYELPSELEKRTRKRWSVDQAGAEQFFLNRIVAVEGQIKELKEGV